MAVPVGTGTFALRARAPLTPPPLPSLSLPLPSLTPPTPLTHLAPLTHFPHSPQVKKGEDAATSVKKVLSAQRGEFGAEERQGQKDINLADDLEGPVK